MGFFDKVKEMKSQYDAKAEEERQRARETLERKKREEEEKEQRIINGLRNSGLMKTVVNLLTQEVWLSESQGSWDSGRRQIIVTPEAVSANDYAEDDYFQMLEGIYPTGSNTVGVRVSSSRHAEQDKSGRWVTKPLGGELGIRYRELMHKRYSDSKAVYISYEGSGYSEIEDKETLKYFMKVLRIVLQEQYPESSFSEIHWNYFELQAFEMYVPEKKKQSISIDDFA